jgi:drug/metabolite transporter (DMT)-like permease
MLMTQRPWLPYVVLLIGVLIVSTAAVMINAAIRLDTHPLSIAAGRLTFAALILTPLTWRQSGTELRQIARRDWLWAFGSGIFLAVHFASWISSLAYTSVASSTALVATNPIFVALASVVLFRERLPPGVWLGVMLTVLGSALIGFSDHGGGSGSNPLLGDALALLGAVCASGYFLVGRSLRTRLSILPYIWMVYSSAAVILLLWMILAGQSLWGLPPMVYLLLLGLAIGPQLLGHTSFNWAIKYLSATFVTVAILGEPVGSAILAYMLPPHESVQPLQLAGGAVLLLGIAVTTRAEHRARQPATEVIEAEGAVAP